MTRRLSIEAEPAFRTEHANPYNARLYRAIQAQGVRVRDLSYLRVLAARVDVVHLHWPDLTFLSGPRQWRVAARLAIFFTFLKVARLRGTRVLWTVHNINAHERRSTPWLRQQYLRQLMGNVDGIIALSASGVEAAHREYPALAELPSYVTPHGHYRDEYDFSTDRAEARRRLGVDPATTLVLSVGQIRPYKNVPTLVSRFRTVVDPAATLVVAGKPASAELRQEILDAVGGDSRITIEPTFQSNERMALWLRACDLVVLPYSAIQNSGSAILAISADRPVLVPAIGAMSELAEMVGSDWVRTYSGEVDGATLADAIRWARAERPETADLSALEWTGIARSTIAAYTDVLARPRRGRQAAAISTRHSTIHSTALGGERNA